MDPKNPRADWGPPSAVISFYDSPEGIRVYLETSNPIYKESDRTVAQATAYNILMQIAKTEGARLIKRDGADPEFREIQ
jgi:hypothetical protein